MFFYPAVRCPEPIDINNGTVAFPNLRVGSNAIYTCNSGFELIGNATTTCIRVDMDNAEFQPEPPSCRREYTAYNPIKL